MASEFTTAGVETILLKGPAFDQLLFGGRRARTYSDIDLLVDPARGGQAEQILKRLGFREADRRPRPLRVVRRAGRAFGVVGQAHAAAWVRDRDAIAVDLHDTLPMAKVSTDDTWRALSAHRTTITVVGSEVETLDRQASAMLVALHAAHHGPGWNRARVDLERACDTLDPDCWRAAAGIARALNAEQSMGIGLGTTDAGREIARALGLRTRPTPADRVRWAIHARL